MKNKKIQVKSKTFKQVVEETEEIKNGYQNGLKALSKYSNKVELGDTKQCDGSVAIDDCTESLYPRENRWDYAFSYKGETYFVEVHSAHTSSASVVLKKLQWLKDWLNSKAPEIKKLQAKDKAFIWIQTNGYHILSNSKQSKLLAQKGLKPVSKLILD